MALEGSIKRCCVVNCSTQRSGKNDVSKIAMHRLPRPGNNGDEEAKKARLALRTRWLCLAGREEKDVTAENEYVCGKHFLPKAYHHVDGENKKLRKLNQNSEPSVFLPAQKESTDSKKSAISLSSESEDQAGSSRNSPNLAENEYNSEALPSNDAEEISPVQASLDLETSTTQLAEPNFYNVEVDGNQTPTSAEKDDREETTPREAGADATSLNRNERTYSRTSFGKRFKHDKRKSSQSNHEGIVISSPGHDDSDDVTNGVLAKESSEAKSSVKVARVVPAPKTRSLSSASQKNQLSIVNGDGQSHSTETGMVQPIAGNLNASASKRRFCEDSDGEPTAESQRKRPNDEQKSQARTKFSPRRSDLQPDAGAINHPEIVAGARNKHGYLKGFTEALLNEALRHMRNAFENQSTQMTRILGQLTADSMEIEERFRDLSCKMNACKRAESTRNVGIQMSSLASSLPSMSADVPGQPQSSGSVSTAASTSASTAINCATQATAQATPVFVRRGRPPANSRSMTLLANTQTTSKVESVIDLTGDTPQVSVICASNGTSSTSSNQSAFSASRLPSPLSSNLVTTPSSSSNTQKLLFSSPPMPALTPLTSAAATSPSITAVSVDSGLKASVSTPVVMQSTSRLSNSLSNLVTNSPKLSMPDAGAQPVPVGSIFSGQQFVTIPAAKTVVPPITSSDSQLSSGSSSQNKSAVVGTTFRLPPGTIVQPVTKATVVSQSSGEAQEQQRRPQYQQQQQQQQPLQQKQPPHQQQLSPQHSVPIQQEKLKSRSSAGRPRHPAPLPEAPMYDNIVQLHTPPAPVLDVKAGKDGIVLTLDMQLQANFKYSPAEKFQIFTYMEGEYPPSTDLWRNIGTIKALKLPMAVTVRSYKSGHRYFFAVRGVDRLNRYGAFNEPKAVDLRESIVL